MTDFSTVNEPAHVRVMADTECEAIFRAMRAGELDNDTAWARVQAVTAAAEVRLLELMNAPTMADVAALSPAPRWTAARLSDHQLAAAVLRDDGHYRPKVPRPIRDRLAACPATGGEPVTLVREYLGGGQ
jgi:hypothetical protein